MYCEFYNLEEKPFTLTPNPDFIYLSKPHQEAFGHLLYGIDHHVGFIELTGEVGTGKTTIIRTLLSQLHPEQYRTALIFNPCLSPMGLLQIINREYGIPHGDLSKTDLLETLNRFLLEQNAAGHTVVLVIDEAQNLDTEVLEQIRMLSNLETKNDKLIQILLVGQSELEAILQKPELRQLNQRITVRYHLKPMDAEDMRNYILHRLKIAGGGEHPGFTDSALKKVYRFTHGLPRLVNAVCDRALLAGYVQESRVITPAMVATAIADIRKPHKSRISIPGALFAGFALLAIAAAAGILSTNQPAMNSANQAVTVRQPENTAPAKPVEPMTVNMASSIQREIAEVPEAENVTSALNALLRIWHAEPLSPQDAGEEEQDLVKLVGRRDLRLALQTGSLGALLRLDTPVLLELPLPGTTGKRYLALMGAKGGQLLISPSVAGRGWVTGAELEMLWGGKSYLIWKNHFHIPTRPNAGARGTAIASLQKLLRQAGTYHGPGRGVYDRATMAAVRSFQASQGMEPDDTMGRRTLILLYRKTGLFPPSRLSQKGAARQDEPDSGRSEKTGA